MDQIDVGAVSFIAEVDILHQRLRRPFGYGNG
jgi:hypothetical protein